MKSGSVSLKKSRAGLRSDKWSDGSDDDKEDDDGDDKPFTALDGGPSAQQSPRPALKASASLARALTDVTSLCPQRDSHIPPGSVRRSRPSTVRTASVRSMMASRNGRRVGDPTTAFDGNRESLFKAADLKDEEDNDHGGSSLPQLRWSNTSHTVGSHGVAAESCAWSPRSEGRETLRSPLAAPIPRASPGRFTNRQPNSRSLGQQPLSKIQPSVLMMPMDETLPHPKGTMTPESRSGTSNSVTLAKLPKEVYSRATSDSGKDASGGWSVSSFLKKVGVVSNL